MSHKNEYLDHEYSTFIGDYVTEIFYLSFPRTIKNVFLLVLKGIKKYSQDGSVYVGYRI